MTYPVRAHQLTIEPSSQRFAAPGELDVSAELVVRNRIVGSLGITAGAHPAFGYAQAPRQLRRVYHFHHPTGCAGVRRWSRQRLGGVERIAGRYRVKGARLCASIGSYCCGTVPGEVSTCHLPTCFHSPEPAL